MLHESAPSTAPRRSPLGAFLALVFTASLLPGAALAAEPVELGQPGAHYEEALAHAGDEISFDPGGRVTVGYTAAAKTAGGARVLTRLPAGLLSGSEMAAGKVATDKRDGAITKILTEESPAADASPDPNAPASPDPNAQPSADPNAGASPIASDPPVATPLATPAAMLPPAGLGSLRRQVIGFLPYWELNTSTLRLRYDLLSTIAYFSVGSDPAGNLIKRNSDGSLTTGWAGWTSSRMTQIIQDAHAAGTRVVLTVTMFAWSSTERSRQAKLLGSATARANLARQLAAAVRDRGADGVNVDFEPVVNGYGDEFTAFVRTLRAELDAIAPGYEITVDTTGYVGNYQLGALVAPGAADAIFLMGYDFRGSSAANAGAIAPIGGPIFDVQDAVRNFLSYIAPSQLILGVPYYGRAWSTVSDAPNAKTQTGTKYGASVTAEYQTAATLAEENGRRYDTVEQSAWTAYRKQNCSSTYGCVQTWRETYYDDAESLGAKYDLVNQLGLRGTGMWALGYDGTRPELWNALAAKFTVPTVPTAGPQLTLRSSANVVTWGDPILLTPSVGGAAAGRMVELQHSPDAATWSTVAQLQTDASGQVAHTVDGMVNRYYRATTTDPTTGQSVTTDPVRVVVRTISILRPTNNGKVRRAALGSTIAFRTTVRPARANYPIPNVRFVAYRLIGGRWQQVFTTDVAPDASGVATVPITFSSRGSWYVRSMALPTPFNANSAWGPIERYDVR